MGYRSIVVTGVLLVALPGAAPALAASTTTTSRPGSVQTAPATGATTAPATGVTSVPGTASPSNTSSVAKGDTTTVRSPTNQRPTGGNTSGGGGIGAAVVVIIAIVAALVGGLVGTLTGRRQPRRSDADRGPGDRSYPPRLVDGSRTGERQVRASELRPAPPPPARERPAAPQDGVDGGTLALDIIDLMFVVPDTEVKQRLRRALKHAGLEEITPTGDRFDPRHHKAIGARSGTPDQEGRIAETSRPGWRTPHGSLFDPEVFVYEVPAADRPGAGR
jgi:hypothetical protein